MCRPRLQLCAFLAGLAASGLLCVSGIKIYTSGEVEAVNGTDVRLKCTFQSSITVQPSSVSVSWNFRPLGPGQHEESVFYYQNKPYLPTEGRFRKRVIWAGDIMGGDASIMLREVKFIYNGTYSCQVKNPPDVHGIAGEVHLRVVTSASYTEIAILAGSIGGGIAVMLMVLGVVLWVRSCRRKRQENLERGPQETKAPRERKDPTLCHPAEALHLYMSDEEIEIDSSDGMISEASTKDPSSEEEEDDSSDDDGGGDDDD
ncbi:hypothetical protein AAFF_G00345940 [Aldrovandia affinis]|uniref:Ig-like domain-containing protein n=1 Tax=Aldrovandia affinis TaxID=143900 RepID=A0AAD7SJE3_9TELE|nr:hypothetical protein AAFF_G00345940 [Aldrovandia affinis]